MRRLCVLLLLSVVLSGTYSQNIWSKNDRISSRNELYFANLSLMQNNSTEMKIYKKGFEYPIWTAWIDWQAGSIGYVSDDGRAFIVINNDYTDRNNIVIVYKENKQAAYSTGSIKIGREFLKYDAGKIIWLKDSDDSVSLIYGEDNSIKSMELKLLNNEVIIIPLE